MRITLNLASRPYADQGPALKMLRIGMAALAVVLIGLVFGLMHFHQSALRMAAQENAVDQSIAKIQQEQRGYQAQMQQPANAKVLTQAQFLNALFDEKSFSWTAAMEDLERVLPGGEQVTAIEPARGKDGRITLRLRVSGPRERSVEMVRNMEHSPRFVAPRIAGENSENSSQGELQPVREAGKVSFDILAEYNPATLEERLAAIAQQKKGHASGGHPPVVKQSLTRPQYIAPRPGPRPAVKTGPGPGPGGAMMPRANVPPGPQSGLPAGSVPPNSPGNHMMNRNRPVQSNVPEATGSPQ